MAESVMAAALTVLLALSSGLWSSLLVRQMVGAFWVALVPPALLFIITTAIPHGGFIFYPALVIYSVAGYKWAHSLFFNAQETGWANGLVIAPAFLSFKTGANDQTRTRRPLTALLAKELRLQQPTLLAIIGLFLFHLLALWVRYLTRNWDSYAGLRNALGTANTVWVMVPLLAGAVSISEERNLGTLAGQLSLPVSTRMHYFLKLAVTLFIGGTVGSLLMIFTKALAPGENFMPEPEEFRDAWLFFTGATLASVYASSLTKNIVQGMAGALIMIALTILYFGYSSRFAVTTGSPELWFHPWSPVVFLTIGLPLAVMAAFWLGSSNFRFADNARLWPRNVRVWLAVLLAIPTLSFLVYQRAWELALTLEPPPGKPVLGFQPGEVRIKSDNLRRVSVILADGRLWNGQMTVTIPSYPFIGTLFFLEKKTIVGGFAPGSNWVDVAVLRDCDPLALRSDGTLWLVGDEPLKTSSRDWWKHLRQYGTETNWARLAAKRMSIVLLKKNGQLCFWGTNAYQLSPLTLIDPQPVGTNKHWVRIEEIPFGFVAWDSNGEPWHISGEPRRGEDSKRLYGNLTRYTVPERLNWKALESFIPYSMKHGARPYSVLLRQDGTLWKDDLSDHALPEPIGSETNWVALQRSYRSIYALKRDGTLWKLQQTNEADLNRGSLADPTLIRASKRHDWIALSAETETISMAVDGTFWQLAQDPRGEIGGLRPSRKPINLGNILQN